MSARRAPSLFRHLWLLWGLRLQIALNREKGGSRWLSVAAFVATSAPGLFLGLAFFDLLRWEPVAESAMWSRFFLGLLGFVTACVWTVWPLLSAGVDDHSEVSRYQAFPISSFRLLVASTLASLLEPRAIVFFAPVIGAALGFLSLHPPSSWTAALALFLLYAAMCAAWSRVALHLVLNVLRQQRSGEMIGGFFVVFLIAASFIPPIDTSWLTQVGGGLSAVSADLIRDAAIALSRVPSGWLGRGVIALAMGRTSTVVFCAVGMTLLTVFPMFVAWRLLVRFNAQVGRSGPARADATDHDPFARTRGTFHTLVVREALDLWRNPRARLLASVPFLLAILLKLISGRDLFVFLVGPAADAWLVGALALYGSVVIASTFSQNTFGYDGHGLAVFLAAPLELSAVLKAKNLVQGATGFVLGLLVASFYLPYFGAGSFWDWACAVLAVAALLPVLLSAGNLLSVYFPVKFHASLKRRDRVPFVASMLGIAAASLGAAPFGLAVKLSGSGGANAHGGFLLVGAGLAAWALYARLLPPTLKLFVARREEVLRAVTRQ